MSTTSSGQTSKKAVHVKWAGKTIALGTFPTVEADEKCARAKALTRAWRSTMRPKPSREWVMNELEKLNVRVVSGRVAQKENSASDSEVDALPPHIASSINPQQRNSAVGALSSINHNAGLLNRRSSITASLLGVHNDRRNSLASLDPSFFLANRQGSLPLPTNVPRSGEKRSGTPDPRAPDPHIPPHRPLVGGGSAAAYEALREDYYDKLAQSRKSQNKDGGNNSAKKLTGGRSLSGGGSVGNIPNETGSLGTLNQIGGMNPMNLPSNANQHYEMLKLHHMNLLNEIQETTLMMNLYQQQQIQQQLQQQNNSQLNNVLTQQQLLTSGNSLGQSGGSLGLGSLMNQPNGLPQMGGMMGGDVGSQRRKSSMNNSSGHSLDVQANSEQKSSDAASEGMGASRVDQLQRIKDEIAERQRMVEQLERMEPKQKRAKTERKEKEI